MKMRVLKLGTVCKDKATRLKGTLTHSVIGMDHHVKYLFQPNALDDEGQPVKQLYFEEERLKVSEKNFERIDIPLNILGSQVTSKSSGFTGMAVELIRHINGCFHITIQPKGVLPKTNSAIARNDFDTRDCSGKEIPELSPKKLEESKKDKPSPSGYQIGDGRPKSLQDSR